MEGHSILNLLNHFVILPYCYICMPFGPSAIPSICRTVILPFCHSAYLHAVLCFCHSVILLFCMYGGREGPFHSAILPSCHPANLPFFHSAILPFFYSSILPFCHSAILPFILCACAIMHTCYHAHAQLCTRRLRCGCKSLVASCFVVVCCLLKRAASGETQEERHSC